MHRKWTEEELRFLKENFEGRRVSEMFGANVAESAIKAMKGKLKIRSGVKPWVYLIERGEKTRFKPGHKMPCYPVGAERVIYNGYASVKISEGEWKSKATVVWEAANGPVPEGCIIIFADKNNQNFDLGNLLCVTQHEKMVMIKNRLICEDADLTKIGKLIADVKIRISERKKGIKNAR